MNMKQRGVAASTAYLERIGQTVLEPSTAPAPKGIDVLSIDGGTLIGTVVIVTQPPMEVAPVPGRALDAALRAITDYRDSHATQCQAVRVDVISILVLAEDRALLRHYREERNG